MNYHAVRITRQAETQIREIAWYISVELRNPIAADNLMDDFKTEISRLGSRPERYPLVDEEPWRSKKFRWTKVKNYLIYFWIDREMAAVHVIGVVYQGREQRDFLSNVDEDR